jgi:hypothetical protein
MFSGGDSIVKPHKNVKSKGGNGADKSQKAGDNIGQLADIGTSEKTETVTGSSGGEIGANVNQGESGFGVDDAASLGVGFTPAGLAADVYTAGTGEDFFTGEEVTGVWRWAGLIPFVSEARKLGKVADVAEEGITAIRKGSDIAGSAFGKAINGASRKTKLQYQGQSIHEVTKNTKLDGFKLRKGDHYYVDGLHKDHIEVFDSRGKARGVLNLNGTFNADKSSKAMSRSIEKLLR